MSDTEDTEGLKTNSISSKNKINIKETLDEKEELLKIGTIEIISDLFVHICEDNKVKKSNKNFLLKSFTNKNIPSISIKDYLLRLSKHAKVNESTIILILIYIDRICKMNHFTLTYYNIHKLILSAFVLAIKYNEENYYKMIYYAKLGGVSLSELKYLESEYLILIQYKLYVETKLFDKYYNDLMSLKCDDDNEDEEEEENEEECEENDEDEKEKEEKEDKEEKEENEVADNNLDNKDIKEELIQQNIKSENKNRINVINYDIKFAKT